MSYYLFIALGGAIGAVTRYWLAGYAEAYNQGNFPLGTFVVNLLGSLLIGFFFVLLVEKIQLAASLRPLIIIGFLGAFTTFSAFSLDVLLLLQTGHYNTAASYIFLSVTTCLLAAWAGMGLSRLIL